jgi:hypothetical protein
MADEDSPVTNGHDATDMWEVRQILLSNSTNRRIAELDGIHEKLASGGRSRFYISLSDHAAPSIPCCR